MGLKEFEQKHWEENAHGLQYRHYAAAEMLATSHERTVLDVGCGDGAFSEMIEDAGHEVRGVDISDSAAQSCAAKVINVDVLDFSATPLPYADGQFDAAVALDVLEHLYDPEYLVREMKRVTSGPIIIGVPNFSSLPARIQVILGRVPENNGPSYGHLQWFTWDVLKTMMTRNALEIVDVRMNAPRGFALLAYLWPSLFALSFVVKCRKKAA